MLYISPVAERILGVPLAQLRAQPLSLIERMDKEDRERIGLEKDGKLHFGSVKGDYRFTRPDGKVIWLRLASVVVNDQRGEAYRAAGVINDITEYMEAQETARERQRQLMQNDKLSSLGMMVSGVAHEINNPNNLIMLNGDVLETFWKHLKPALRERSAGDPSWRVAGLAYDNAEGKIESLISGIGGGARRIKRIVDNLKDFARTDPGGMTESVAMEKVIDASVSIVENLIKKSTDRFTITHEDNLPRVRGNFQKLEQVVINLITNACQALEGRNKAIAIATRRDQDEVVLSVRDEGTGIPAELIGMVADPFFTTKRDKGGTGLGLSVSYGIVQEHRGRMEFRSEAGKGTEIEIRIPAEAGKA
jgi:polar amino acid transport system substrate-binding protein